MILTTSFFHRGLAVAVFLFILAGCTGTKTSGVGPTEGDIQSAVGTISHIAPAYMIGKEIRRGDIAITVDLNDGRMITVVQPEDSVYVVGDRVRIIRSGKGFSRVQLL